MWYNVCGVDVCLKSTEDVLIVERGGTGLPVERGNIDHEVRIEEDHHVVAVDKDIKDLVVVSATGLEVEIVVIRAFVEEATERRGHVAEKRGDHVAEKRDGHVAKTGGHVAETERGHIAERERGHVAERGGEHVAKRKGHIAGKKSLMLTKKVLFK